MQIYPEGKMSQHLDTLKVGDVLEVKGYVLCVLFNNVKLHSICFLSLLLLSCSPIEKLRYSPNMKKQIGMVI